MFGISKERFAIYIAAIALLLTGMVGASAEDAKKTDRPSAPEGPSWLLNCSNANTAGAFRCELQQTLFVTQTRQRALSIVISKEKPGSNSIIANLQLPHGINFLEGISIQIDDGQKTKLAVSHADVNGSYASFVLDKTMLAALKKGDKLTVSMQPLQGDTVSLEISLKNFGPIFDQFQSM